MIYVLCSDEKLLLDRKLTELKETNQCHEDTLNYSLYPGDSTPMEAIYQDVCTPPFGMDKKMVVVKNIPFLTSAKTKIEDTQVDLFLRALEEKLTSVILVLYHTGDHPLDARKKAVKQLKKKAQIVSMDKPSPRELKDIVLRAVKQRNCTIDEDALTLLLQRIDGSVTQAYQEVEKLGLYAYHITKEGVDQLVTKPLEESVFALTTAITQKNYADIFRVYHDLQILREEPIKIIVLLASQMRLLYQVKVLLNKGYTDNEITKMLGITSWRLRYLKQDGVSYDKQELLAYLQQLASLDQAIKAGRIDKEQGLVNFLIHM